MHQGCQRTSVRWKRQRAEAPEAERHIHGDVVGRSTKYRKDLRVRSSSAQRTGKTKDEVSRSRWTVRTEIGLTFLRGLILSCTSLALLLLLRPTPFVSTTLLPPVAMIESLTLERVLPVANTSLSFCLSPFFSLSFSSSLFLSLSLYLSLSFSLSLSLSLSLFPFFPLLLSFSLSSCFESFVQYHSRFDYSSPSSFSFDKNFYNSALDYWNLSRGIYRSNWKKNTRGIKWA